jgi:hypothetical protein
LHDSRANEVATIENLAFGVGHHLASLGWHCKATRLGYGSLDLRMMCGGIADARVNLFLSAGSAPRSGGGGGHDL